MGQSTSDCWNSFSACRIPAHLLQLEGDRLLFKKQDEGGQDFHAIIQHWSTDYYLRSGAVFIDNRPEHKFALGHIAGAVNIPFFVPEHPGNQMTREILIETIGNRQVVVFYCTGMMRAYQALKQAEQWGVSAEMYWYKNGFTEWMSLKNPVVL